MKRQRYLIFEYFGENVYPIIINNMKKILTVNINPAARMMVTLDNV